MEFNLEKSWFEVLKDEYDKDYFLKLQSFLNNEEKLKTTIYPSKADVFNAFNITPFEQVKVVILGQDPYHGAGQAHGLSFSVQDGIKPPPSLKNIYKELEGDLDYFKKPEHGNLTSWAKQGVLLLNATLTVKASTPGSHQKKGWENFTDVVIKTLSDKKENLIFILWGNFAQQKASLINQGKHYIIKSAHPSPFSAYNGFFGSKPFSKTNEFLTKNGLTPIDWSL
jgi:uracil-DNA glycosylase